MGVNMADAEPKAEKVPMAGKWLERGPEKTNSSGQLHPSNDCQENPDSQIMIQER